MSDKNRKIAHPRTPPPAPEPYLEEQVPRTLVRPYVLTRGRTHSSRNLAIEALISARADAPWNGTRVTGEFRSAWPECCWAIWPNWAW